ncbi:competence protein ComG [Lysinibacillus sp. BF-4]|uniref:competence type IV pilus ATPase ComGA n=1 Tax=Lysinibacillus sp. BF-4 TaxID=1473546 RepID=UPI000502FFAC|nr:competence type IV pilus ATPase ComGA [Lysinibacillus sp. BF-4]KFL44563.1 competence protein ComG [Lysinibacillus sp. BF-4]
MVVESVIEKKCDQLLQKAIQFNASDIQLTPLETNYYVYFKRNNYRMEVGEITTDLGERMISYFKFLSSLDISEKRKPQSGAFKQQISTTLYAFRVSTLPAVQMKESLIIRVLLQNQSTELETLSYFPQSAKSLLALTQTEQGIIILTGATGSGKTTSLYSLIHHSAHALNRNVISLEDPVESNQQNILQIQVNERAGVTYATGLKAILRHSPDVIMVGEIRDTDTAKVAIEAALTGHLVLTTVHAKDTVGCLYRMLSLGISFEDLRQSVVGIVAQQLITVADERTAIYEILQGDALREAFSAIRAGDWYSIPTELSLAYQKRCIANLETSS